jgi:NAD(P)-dependent dehydrogenase (short-subunit alcohol dehydrogenase family)
MTAVLETLFGLAGQVAVVTGGGAGIGRATAERLAEAGADVAILDAEAARAEAAAGAVRERGRRVLALAVDVSDEAAVDAAVARVVDTFGRLDVLVNNAGIYPVSPIAEMPVAEWDRVLGVNLRGAFLGLRAAARAMRTAGTGGSIVNVSSIESMHPSLVGMAHYGASKAGLNQLTKSAALEFAKDAIRVNAICPGGTLTDGTAAAMFDGLRTQLEARIPLGRVASADEIASVILFLAGPAARYVTGATLVVDGGYLVS